MSIQIEQIGRFENVKVVEFGTGDIALCNALMGEKDPYGNDYPELWLRQHTKKPVESWQDKETDNDVPLGDEIVLLRFTRPESIESLILSLNELKESFAQSK